MFVLPTFNLGVVGNVSQVPVFNRFSVQLDGTDDYVALGNSSALAPSNITVSLWFKASGTVGVNNYLFAREGALYGSYLLRYTNANKFNLFLSFGGGANFRADITSGSTFTLTDWHHIAFTYNQTNVKLYVDGVEEFSAAETRAIDYTPSTTYGTDNTYIGKGTFADNAEGLIDEVAIFNTALSASDVAALRDTTGSNPVPADISSLSPVGWWRMGDGSDGSGNNDGTVVGGLPQIYNVAKDGSGNRITGIDGSLTNITSPDGIVADVPS